MKFINETNKSFNYNELDFIDELLIKTVSSEDDIDVYQFIFKLNSKERKEFTITWEERVTNVFDLYVPWNNSNKRFIPSYVKNKTASCVFLASPFIVALNQKNESILNLSVDDCVNEVKLGIGPVEETGLPECELNLLKSIPVETLEYKINVRVDKRIIDFNKSVKEVTNILYNGNNSLTYPSCFEPLYSSWYNFHKNVDQDELLKEMVLAKEYGLKTLIVDDGWQIQKDGNNNSGYSVAGDWKVATSKFPNLLKFVEDCHDLGIKVMFWVAIPFVGHACSSYNTFKSKLLWDGNDCGTLDPRYKECRDYMINSCVKLVKENGLDGLKLDFVDSFQNYNNVLYNKEMDIESLANAVVILFKELKEELNKYVKEPLIEFRQNYTSPGLLTNANMIRVGDCPIEYKSNYNEIAYLRLTTNAAVHSDMVIFNSIEQIEQKARHLYATLFSVPQMSFVLAKLNNDEQKLLKNYLLFHEEYRQIIFADNFELYRNNGVISYATNEYNGIRLYALYISRVINIEDKTNIFANMTGENKLYFELNENKKYHIIIKNYFNEICDSFDVENVSILDLEDNNIFIIEIKEF